MAVVTDRCIDGCHHECLWPSSYCPPTISFCLNSNFSFFFSLSNLGSEMDNTVVTFAFINSFKKCVQLRTVSYTATPILLTDYRCTQKQVIALFLPLLWAQPSWRALQIAYLSTAALMSAASTSFPLAAVSQSAPEVCNYNSASRCAPWRNQYLAMSRDEEMVTAAAVLSLFPQWLGPRTPQVVAR